MIRVKFFWQSISRCEDTLSFCLRNSNFAQPEGIQGQQGTEPVPDGGVRVPSLSPYNLLTTCRPLMVWDNTLLPAQADRTLM